MKQRILKLWSNIKASGKALKDIWNKDFAGALMVAAGIFGACYALFSIGGCTIAPEYRPTLKLGAAIEADEDVVGRNPVGRAGVTMPLYPFPKYMELEYLHLSSLPDFNDKATVDQFGINFNIPLGRSSAGSSDRCRP